MDGELWENSPNPPIVHRRIANCPPPPPIIAESAPIPILPEDHSCEGRNLKGQRPSPHLATQHCEIPAYAGMSLWGNGELSPPCRQLSTTADNSPPKTHRRRRQMPKSTHTHPSPTDNNAKIRPRFPFPLKTIPAKAGISKGNALPRRMWRHNTVRFLPTQEWSCGGMGNCGRIRQIRQLSTAASPIVRRRRIVATMI